jgi:hypothetical protein
LSLTDATTLYYKAVYVTIARVDVHLGGNENSPNNWKTVATPARTYNLLELVNGVREHLGLAELDAGSYTQMRLIIGSEPDDDGLNIFHTPHPHANYVVLAGTDEIHELKVPSGPQTGIKLVHGFTVMENQTTELILDFNAATSVVKAGASGLWLLKPTIKVLNTEEYCIVSGTVEDEGSNGLPGVLISAQIYDDSADDPKDSVVIQTSTVTDENGEYKLFLEPGKYNIVAYGTGYIPAVECSVELEAGVLIEDLNFELWPAEAGTVDISVSIAAAEEDQHATISFRQWVDCNGVDTEFEVVSVNVGNDGTFELELPAGFYDVVASSLGKDTLRFFSMFGEYLKVVEDDTTELDVVL